jgi:hypothetical protein
MSRTFFVYEDQRVGVEGPVRFALAAEMNQLRAVFPL